MSCPAKGLRGSESDSADIFTLSTHLHHSPGKKLAKLLLNGPDPWDLAGNKYVLF